MPGHCPICHSDTWRMRPGECDNPTCLGLSDEHWAIASARRAFALDEIDVDELERRIDVALTDPPRHARDRTIIR